MASGADSCYERDGTHVLLVIGKVFCKASSLDSIRHSTFGISTSCCLIGFTQQWRLLVLLHVLK
jgi:hypothetical protein